jgi:hypothetical protein
LTGEETYYSDGTVWVTNLRVIFGEATYPLAEIKSAKIEETLAEDAEPPLPWTVLLFITLAAAVAAAIGADVAENRGAAGLSDSLNLVSVLSMGLFIGGIIFFEVKERWSRRRPVWELLLGIGLLALYVFYVAAALLDENLFERIKLPLFVPIALLLLYFTKLRKVGYIFTIVLEGAFGKVEAFSSEEQQRTQRIVNYIRYALLRNPSR